jgi:hypothetical protein
MALTILQKSTLSSFPKPAELIEITGTSGLEAQDRVLMNALYRHAHDSGDLAKPGARWSLPMAELNIGTHKGLERVRESLRRLLGVQVTVTHKNDAGAPRVLQTILFSHFDTPLSGPGDLIFGIPEELRAILAKSGRWGRIKAEVVHAMSSKYAIALYELLRLRASMDNCVETLPVDRFRALLGVPPGTYADGKDFRRFVVEPATLEVNGLSELGCKIELVRAHSRAPITKVVLAWWKKGDEEQRPAIQELNRSKLGRKARLRGEVETVEPAPALVQTDLEEFTK